MKAAIEANKKSFGRWEPDFKTERHNVFTEEINSTAPNHDKIMQSNDLIEIYTYGTRKDLVTEKQEIKCNNT